MVVRENAREEELVMEEAVLKWIEEVLESSINDVTQFWTRFLLLRP